MNGPIFSQGREYDEEGNMRQWWNNVTLNTFKNRTSCMENQVKWNMSTCKSS